jgi:hypothetical protein
VCQALAWAEDKIDIFPVLTEMIDDLENSFEK